MDTTVVLDAHHFETVTKKARQLRTTPQAYIHSLIDADGSSFDEILAPVRNAVRRAGITEEELDEAVGVARKRVHQKSRQSGRK